MIIKLEARKALITRAKELMNKLSLNALDALRMAENEYIDNYKNKDE